MAAKKKERDAGDEVWKAFEAKRKEIRDRYERPTLVYEDDPSAVPMYKSRFPNVTAAVGGFPGGSIVEIYGPEESAKTSFAVTTAADVQRQAPKDKKHVLVLNYERVYKGAWKWWRALGLDTDPKNFTMLAPRSLEEGVANAMDLIDPQPGSGYYPVCAVVIDSVYAASSREGREAVKNWADADAKKSSLGAEARAWGVAWTQLVSILRESETVCLAVNQIREDIMAFAPKGMPRPTTTPRGRALKFYAWFRLELRGSRLDPEAWKSLLDAGGAGRHVRIKVIKNGASAATPGTVELDMVRGKGFDLTSLLFQSGLECGAIEHAGSSYSFEGERLAVGKQNALDRVRSDVALQAKLATMVEAHYSTVAEAPPEPPKEDDLALDESAPPLEEAPVEERAEEA